MRKENNTNKLVNKNRDILRKQIIKTCDNLNKSSNNYSNFLITLAGIYLGLSPLVVGLLTDFKDISLFLKILMILSLECVLVSLVFGAINFFLEKSFYRKWMNIYGLIFKKWEDVKIGKISIEEVRQYERAVYETNSFKSPIWSVFAQGFLIFSGFAILVIILSIIILK